MNCTLNVRSGPEADIYLAEPLVPVMIKAPRRPAMTEPQIRFEDGAAYERMMGVWSRLAGEIFFHVSRLMVTICELHTWLVL